MIITIIIYYYNKQVVMTVLRGTDEVENHDAYIAGSDRKYLAITLGIIFVAYLLSMSTDCLGIVLELNGILAAVPLAYVLPALCYLRLEEGPLLSKKKLPALGNYILSLFTTFTFPLFRYHRVIFPENFKNHFLPPRTHLNPRFPNRDF